MEENEMTLDYTTLSDFLTCRKKYYWRHQRQLAPIEKPAAPTFGHACHTAWAVYYRGGSVEDALKAFEDEYKDFEVPEGDKRTMELGLKVLKDYFKRYKHNPFKVIDVEISHKIKISDTLTLAVRMDTTIDWDGIRVMEHKTTSGLGAKFFDQFKLHHQVDCYILGCEDKYGKCEGVCVDAMLVAKTKFNCLRERNITRSFDHADNFKAELLDIEKNIRWANKEKSYPKDKGSCDYYGECIFKNLCYYEESFPKAVDKVIETRYKEAIWDAGEGKVVTEK